MSVHSVAYQLCMLLNIIINSRQNFFINYKKLENKLQSKEFYAFLLIKYSK